jgi:hemolysin activation/secretion protein
MVRFNRSNDAQMRADLQPGEAFGETDVVVTIVEPKRNDIRLFVDNLGSIATGDMRLGTALMRRSLTGRRDDLYFSAVKTDGSTGNYLTYGLPVNTLGTRVTLGYFSDKTKIVNGQIAVLNVTGEATTQSLSVRHPLLAERDYEFDALLAVKKRRTVNWIDGNLLSAADLYGGTIGLDLQVPDAAGYWSAGAELGSGRNEPLGADKRSYHLARGSLRRNMALNADWTLIGNVNWQYTTDLLLPSSEQIIIGGESTVRGYATGLFSGGRGYILNLEAHRSVELPKDWTWKATGFGFLDRGEVRPFRPPGNQRSTDVITSWGGGVNFSYAKDLTGRIVFGFPISKPPEEPRDYRINFQLVWFLL